ncbi:hemogen isoform X2 [Nelusetta ayraudi]|uniref:hemogen isoform X2 n=1 Tax=Nelusetta ayraudi TaxID=303726 RepID=UPI003F726ADF
MAELAQQERQELEYKEPNEDQGGIRRRLRDRDLLRKRKAEAEEKETNQEESLRKRQAGDRSGTKKRGRPRKTEPTPDISLVQEEAPVPQEAPAVVVVPEAAEKVPDQILGAQSQLPATESQPTTVRAAPLSVFGSALRPLFAKDLAPPVPANPIQAPLLASVPATDPTKDEDTGSVAVQDLVPPPAPAPAPELDDAPVLALSQEPNPPNPSTDSPAPSTALSGIGPLFTESREWESRNQVTIEDLGPDEEEDIALPQGKIENDGNDSSGAPSNNISEQNKVPSFSTISSPPPPQEYLPDNSF